MEQEKQISAQPRPPIALSGRSRIDDDDQLLTFQIDEMSLLEDIIPPPDFHFSVSLGAKTKRLVFSIASSII